jgi:hypothetical protein
MKTTRKYNNCSLEADLGNAGERRARRVLWRGRAVFHREIMEERKVWKRLDL